MNKNLDLILKKAYYFMMQREEIDLVAKKLGDEKKEENIKKDLSYILQVLKDKRIKLTSQRKIILDIFLKLGGHVSVEEIFQEIRKKKKNIGLATIYRTFSLLKNLGLVSQREFGDGFSRFEIVSSHHDHLICQKCGKVIEFKDERIEDIQEEIAKKFGFVLISHRHELVGICSDCRETL
jgi:Fur family ferric uptake transcriptional regulator